MSVSSLVVGYILLPFSVVIPSKTAPLIFTVYIPAISGDTSTVQDLSVPGAKVFSEFAKS